jgi:DNA repair ATPase RecN
MVCTDSGEVIEFTDPVIEERQQEIARMLGGVKLTAQSRAHAREMLEAAG